MQQHWRSFFRLSRPLAGIDSFLERAGPQRGPWLTVSFASGIAAWFILPHAIAWVGFAITCVIAYAASWVAWRARSDRTHLLLAVQALAVTAAAGLLIVWARSALVGAPPIEGPQVGTYQGTILDRIEQPAQQRVRLVLATRDGKTGKAIKVRVNIPLDWAGPELVEGAQTRLRARLMPPAPPPLPGGYDFARAAWFDGLAGSGSALSPPVVISGRIEAGPGLGAIQRNLSQHVREHIAGPPGTIAAAFVSGDRGAITAQDEDAMRDAGLTHLLSISGLHVSALVAGVYFIALRLLALWPWLALRVRLPIVAALAGAVAGLGYTILTGAEVPTVRSCIAALLVLFALVIGREPLSLRLVAVGAFAVLLLWPESIVHPGFQMSFAAVLTIVALHASDPVRRFLRPREEPVVRRAGRQFVMLLMTGVAIELALMPIVLFHFHRTGLYGALANVVAIPLVTFVTMPALAVGLALSAIGLGNLAWLAADWSLRGLLGIAHFAASKPNAVNHVPQVELSTLLLFAAGALWLGLWSGRVRLWGLAPVALSAILILRTPTPDVLVTGDGDHVAIQDPGQGLFLLRDTRSDFTREALTELAATGEQAGLIARMPNARCNADFCAVRQYRAGRPWDILIARSRERVPWQQLIDACAAADIVIAPRTLPKACQPRWIKLDRAALKQGGGAALYLGTRQVERAVHPADQHPWRARPAAPADAR